MNLGKKKKKEKIASINIQSSNVDNLFWVILLHYQQKETKFSVFVNVVKPEAGMKSLVKFLIEFFFFLIKNGQNSSVFLERSVTQSLSKKKGLKERVSE